MPERNSAHSSRAEKTAVAQRSRSVPWWVAAIVILGAVLTAMGALIALIHPAMLVSPRDQINGAVHIYAGYLFARNLVMAVMLLGLLFMRARRALGNLMVLVGFIQLLDACMDLAEGRWTIAPGVLVFGVVFLIGAARLADGLPFWKPEAWKR